MDNQLEPITLNTFNEQLKNDIAFCCSLEYHLECDCSLFDTCFALADQSLALENISPEGAAYLKQQIKQYYTNYEAQRDQYIPFYESSLLNFDNLPNLKVQLSSSKDYTKAILAVARDTSAAIHRFPELLYTLHTMKEKGISTDDIELSIRDIDFREIDEAIHSQGFHFLNKSLRNILSRMNFYRLQVQKLEHWIYQKAGETSINIAPQTIQALFADQLMNMVEKASEKGAAKALDKHDKKQRGPLRKSGAGKKPTFDTLDLQCQEFWDLYLADSSKDPHDYARKILNNPKWLNPKFKKDNPFLYTPNMTEEAKRTVRKNLIKRFITWCKTTNKSDPFPKK